MPYLSKETRPLLLKLSWPVMLGMILQCGLATVDAIFISRLGTAAQAAAGLGNSLSGVIIFFSTLVSAGTVALVARSSGEQDEDAIRQVCGMSFTLSALVGLVAGVICMLAAGPMVKFMFNPDP